MQPCAQSGQHKHAKQQWQPPAYIHIILKTTMMAVQLNTTATGNRDHSQASHRHSITAYCIHIQLNTYNSPRSCLQQSKSKQKRRECETMSRTRSWVCVVVQFVDSPRKRLLCVLVKVRDGDTSCEHSVVRVGGCQRRCRLCSKLIQL